MGRRFQSYDQWESALLSDEPDVELSSFQAERFLVTAVMDDHHQRVGAILDHSRWGHSQEMDQTNSNPVRMALSLGHQRCLEVFLERLDCANWPFEHRQTLLHQAVEQAQLWAVELLIDHGARLNAPNIARLTPVSLAGHLGRSEELSLMLERARLDQLPFENTDKRQWELSYPASALTEALVAYAQGALNLSAPADQAFLRSSCEMLRASGSSANEPIGALAMLTRALSSNFTAKWSEVEEVLNFAIELGADWKAIGPDGRNALEEALFQLSAPITSALERAGARLEDLALPAGYWVWKSVIAQALDRREWETSSRLKASAAEINAFCDRSGFHPPFARNESETAHFLSTLLTRPTSEIKRDLERLELSAVALPALAARKPAPRV